MAVYEIPQHSFVVGMVTPSVSSREELDIYERALEVGENVLINPQGDIQGRPGLRMIEEVSQGRMRNFIFNRTQRYLLIFREGAIDVYRDEVKIFTSTDTLLASITTARLKQITFAQRADVMLIFHEDFQTLEFARYADNDWRVSEAEYKNIPVFPFDGVTVSNPAAAITPSAKSGRVSIEADASVFSSSHVGQYIAMSYGRVRIQEFESGTKVIGAVEQELFDDAQVGSGDWELEVGYEPVMSSTRGWPGSGTFSNDDRLVVGGLKSRPQTRLESATSEYFNFDVGIGGPTDAIDESLGGNTISQIIHVHQGTTLQLLTSSGMYFVPNNPDGTKSFAQETSEYPAGNVPPVRLDGATFYADENGKVIYELVYNDIDRKYNADNATLLFSAYINNIQAMAHRGATQTNDAQYLFVVNGDGTVGVLNKLRAQNLHGWSQLTTLGEFEDVCVIGSDVYFIVKRSINGVEKRFLEIFDDAHVMDCSVKLSSETPQQVWTDTELEYLNGQEVYLRGDEYPRGSTVVDTGSVNMTEEVSDIEVGLFKSVRVKNLPPSLTKEGKELGGVHKGVAFVKLNLIDTGEIRITSGAESVVPPVNQFGDPIGGAPNRLNGWIEVYISSSDTLAQIEITQDQPDFFRLQKIISGVRV
ncbi:MAG: hypothetical protein CMF62_06390 [Magnetococcales bacterium]|nr:hypothetical protein [Magnetococcales bacterium]|tara:strand:- start:306445 stop:308379 length:1935 start_codon:yes stop_codon:yes gene_type:complete